MAYGKLPKTSDEQLAIQFLNGFRVYSNGQEDRRYLELGSTEELKAREAFLRLIQRSDLHESLRVHLSMLFSPVSKAQPRELIFQFRKGGKRCERDVRLALDVALKVDADVKVEAAIMEVAKVYGVKRATAFRAWEKHGKSLLNDAAARDAVARLSDDILVAGLGIPYTHKR